MKWSITFTHTDTQNNNVFRNNIEFRKEDEMKMEECV